MRTRFRWLGGLVAVAVAVTMSVAVPARPAQEIQLHIDEASNRDVKACAEAALTKFAGDIAALPPDLLALFVNDAVDCATLAVETFDVVRTTHIADHIGKLMGVIFSMAITGWTYYGLSPVPKNGDPAYFTVWCEAYDGDVGAAGVTTVWPQQPTAADYDRAKLDAGRNTSYTVAANALPHLRAALASAQA